MRKKKVPESLEELPSGLFPPERHIQITSENFIDFTFKRIKYSPDKEPTFKEITISREQWAEMIKKYGAIENAAIDNMFQCMDFLTAYKTFCEGLYVSSGENNSTRQHERNNSTGENNSTQQQERTTQLGSRNETTQLDNMNETTQLVSRNETTQLCTAVDRLQPPTTTCTAFTAESAFSTYCRP
ncbi:hypothetical protein TNCV_4661881 [Trichonephila clavipes]|uniref:Uncharacterized protein n=1 Tax=Trichonephila clavipes TaxID=2585209 RepID=A0A8X6SGW7_TRICX|nr:hypothetical protein TNCV_4661881 [Trichonephila clavipes]